MSISIEATNIKEVKNFLDKKKKSTENQQKEGLTRAAIYLQGEVKSSIAGHRDEKQSVDTGRFLNSVGFQLGKDDGIVYTNIPYAKFLEFGTSKFTGRKHFENSKNRSQNKITSLIQEAINKI